MIETLEKILYVSALPLVVTILVLLIRRELKRDEPGSQSRWRHLRTAGGAVILFAAIFVAQIFCGLSRNYEDEYQPHAPLKIHSAAGGYEYIPALTGKWVLSERSQFFVKLHGLQPPTMRLELSPDGNAYAQNIFRDRNCYIQDDPWDWYSGAAQFRVIDDQDHRYHVEVMQVSPGGGIHTIATLTISGYLPYLTLGVDVCDDASLWQLRKE